LRHDIKIRVAIKARDSIKAISIKELLIICIALACFAGCMSKAGQTTRPVNDTAEAINLAIRAALPWKSSGDISPIS